MKSYDFKKNDGRFGSGDIDPLPLVYERENDGSDLGDNCSDKQNSTPSLTVLKTEKTISQTLDKNIGLYTTGSKASRVSPSICSKVSKVNSIVTLNDSRRHSDYAD